MSLQALAALQRQLAELQAAAAGISESLAESEQRAVTAERRERAIARQLDAILSEANEDERTAYRRGYLSGRESANRNKPADPDGSFERGRQKRERARRGRLEVVA